jgi:hypothetical protein
MSDRSHQITTDHITTDDLAFSAYLKMKGYRLIRCHQNKSKTVFIFEVNGNDPDLKVEFINSPFLQYYNELRNLKKMI